MLRNALLCLTLLVPAAAAAQPLADAPDRTPPGDDLSQIRGTPVKVGEHGDYYYSFKRWNLATNPIGALMGFYNASLSYAVNERVALRVDFNIIRPVGSEFAMFEGGIGAPIYFRKMYSGFFLEPGLIIRSDMQRGARDSYEYEDDPVFGPQMLVGWHWSWDSGLNVAAALGAGRNLNAKQSPYNSGDELFGNGYFRVGYLF